MRIFSNFLKPTVHDFMDRGVVEGAGRILHKAFSEDFTSVPVHQWLPTEKFVKQIATEFHSNNNHPGLLALHLPDDLHLSPHDSKHLQWALGDALKQESPDSLTSWFDQIKGLERPYADRIIRFQETLDINACKWHTDGIWRKTQDGWQLTGETHTQFLYPPTQGNITANSLDVAPYSFDAQIDVTNPKDYPEDRLIVDEHNGYSIPLSSNAFDVIFFDHSKWVHRAGSTQPLKGLMNVPDILKPTIQLTNTGVTPSRPISQIFYSRVHPGLINKDLIA